VIIFLKSNAKKILMVLQNMHASKIVVKVVY